MNINKEVRPILLTLCLLAAVFIVFILSRSFPNSIGDLTTTVWIYLFIDMGFIVSLILGVRTKKPSFMWFSIISNGIFFTILSIFIFLLTLANGLSEV